MKLNEFKNPSIRETDKKAKATLHRFEGFMVDEREYEYSLYVKTKDPAGLPYFMCVGTVPKHTEAWASPFGLFMAAMLKRFSKKEFRK